MTLRKIAILLSATFLGIASLVQMYNELAFHFYDQGPLRDAFSAMPGATLGFFEAHGLAFLWAFYLLRQYRKKWTNDLHLYALLVHLLLGSANIIFWTDLFMRFDMTQVGWPATILHYLLVLLHGYILAKKYDPSRNISKIGN